MPLELYVYCPSDDPSITEEKKWVKGKTVYPGEEIQIPNLPLGGKLELIRVKVKSDDSMSTLHTVYPTQFIIRDRNSVVPSQVEFDDNQSKNLPTIIKKGESHEVYSRMPVQNNDGTFVGQIVRGKLIQR